jgi:hypothetical protein
MPLTYSIFNYYNNVPILNANNDDIIYNDVAYTIEQSCQVITSIRVYTSFIFSE